MTTRRMQIGAVLALAVFLCCGAAALAGEPRTMNGEFYWDGGDAGGDLEAVFTPTGERSWDVAFHFEFRGKRHTYTGTAEGSLTDGSLRGSATSENEKRTWNFAGTFEGGEFRGTHQETTGGRQTDSGTLILR